MNTDKLLAQLLEQEDFVAKLAKFLATENTKSTQPHEGESHMQALNSCLDVPPKMPGSFSHIYHISAANRL